MHQPKTRRSLTTIVLLLSFALSLLMWWPTPSLAVGALPPTVRIMPLGDSITESYVTNSLNNPSYRYFLWNRLITAGYAVDFVGSRTTRSNSTNLYPDFEVHHQGSSGARVDELIPGGWRHTETVSAIQAANPDMVLLHIGTNDLIQNRAIPAIVQDVSELIDLLRTTNPTVTVLLAQVLTCQYNGCTPTRVTEYNAQLSTLAASKSTPTAPVVLVDQHGAVPPSELPDQVHPSATGERLMAERWFAALAPRLPASPGLSVDNSVAGDGLNNFRYTGAWTTCSGCDAHAVGLFGGGFSSSNSSDATAQFPFTSTAGGQIKLYLVKTAAAGRAAISLDGGPETLVDLYSGSDQRYTTAWVSPPLSAGIHTLTVRVTGTQQAASAGPAVGLDRVELFGAPLATATATIAPTVTPTAVAPSATATIAPTVTPTDLPASGASFYRAININGPATLIDGNAWEAQSAVSSFSIDGSARSNPWLVPTPATDPARAAMLRSFQVHWALSARLADMPTGSYQVYLYVIQDWNNPNPPLVTFSLEGQVAGTYRAGNAGSWARLGPYPVTINDGTLNLSASQMVNLAGIALDRIDAAPGSPTATATAAPTVTSTSLPPTATATAAPTVTSTAVAPTATATIAPTVTPTDVAPTATATIAPTVTPTAVAPSATATIAPTVTPTAVAPSATATIAPTVTPTDLPASGASFYRAININGPATLIDGNTWEAQSAVSTFTIDGNARSNPWLVPAPATDPNHTAMLQSFQHHWALQARLAELPTGSYQVYLYVIQDWNNPNPPLVTFSLEGQAVGTYRAGSAGSWARLGPYPVTVNDGTLNLSASQLVNLAGIALYR